MAKQPAHRFFLFVMGDFPFLKKEGIGTVTTRRNKNTAPPNITTGTQKIHKAIQQINNKNISSSADDADDDDNGYT